MAFSVNVSEDIEKYEETVYASMTAGQIISAILTLGVSVIQILIFYYIVGKYIALFSMLETCVYASLPLTFLIGIMLMYKKEDMNFFQLLDKRKYHKKMKKPVLYHSTENIRYFEQYVYNTDKKEKEMKRIHVSKWHKGKENGKQAGKQRKSGKK